MTDAPSSPGDDTPDGDGNGGDDDDRGDAGDAALSSEEVYEAMEPPEPYTTGELASALDVPRRFARRLLDRLADEETIREKKSEPSRVIWIREPPKHECPNCGGEFEVRYFHPVFQAVQFCPTCGTWLRRRERS